MFTAGRFCNGLGSACVTKGKNDTSYTIIIIINKKIYIKLLHKIYISVPAVLRHDLVIFLGVSLDVDMETKT